MSDEYRLTVPEERNSWERNQQTTDAMVEKSKVRGKPQEGRTSNRNEMNKRNRPDSSVDTL
jgi:hypothetical protein